jgi:hypothetical protein
VIIPQYCPTSPFDGIDPNEVLSILKDWKCLPEEIPKKEKILSGRRLGPLDLSSLCARHIAISLAGQSSLAGRSDFWYSSFWR